ncbi:SMC family ATPase [uncultured Cellulomonas sp.]|uniref:AAA family ATPase n=1 Tax=uncultured Cellulomonas sp. TaxID=189682 RepID=UPI002617821B|nr:SMC family ATPase [uncultured Cellulomonas sp.]
MHLRTMTLQALGPFAGTHTIDFAELGASGLYLLEGPTGAGKSTLIDAVVFALYGKVAAAATSDDRLRSGFARDDVDTVVDLVFETGAGVYRVRRTPERLRAKKRGAGTTRQPATIKLWRLTDPDDPDGGELLSTRLDEAGPEIQRVIGLDRTQFVQTIVLPQGEFASFLRADPEQRRGLLQKVFGTEVYERVQDRLVVMRREAQATVESARSVVATAAAHFVGAASVTDDVRFAVGRAWSAAGLPEVDAVPGRSDGAAGEETDRLATAAELRALGDHADPDLLPAAQAHATALAHEAERDAGRLRAAQSALTSAREGLDAERALADSVARRDRLRREHAELISARDVQAEAVERRDLARRAAVVGSLLAGADAARAEAHAAHGSVERLRAAHPDLAELDGEGLAAARESLAAEAVRLARLGEIERGLPARRRALAAQEGALAADVAEQAALTRELGGRPALRTALEESVADLGAVAAQANALRAEHAAVTGRRDAAVRAAGLEDELATARTAVTAAVSAARRAVDTEADLRARRLAGMAGELAASLVPGDPCPVCGGADHPRVAALADDHPDAEAVTAAERARTRAETSAADAVAQVTRLSELLASLRAVAGDAGPDEQDALLSTLASQVAQCDAAQQQLVATRRRLAAHDAETDVLLDRARTLDVAVAHRRATLDSLVTALEADAKEVDAARAGAASVAARLAEIEATTRSLTDLTRAQSAAVTADEALRRRTGELEQGLAEHGFPDADAARSALLPAADLRRLEDAIGAYAAALSRVEAGLAEPAVAGLGEDVVVDVDAARRACAAAEEQAQEAARQATLSARCAAAAAAGVREVAAALTAHGQARRAAEPVARMADLASAAGGDNAKRLTLATYVLTRRFEDVVAAANDRLAGMSDGRFELVRSEDREDVGSRKRGLAMKVVDHRLESERDPRTLSGGETFYVSLCLALGMADVVTAEAGGIDLGTLFVDEGFGTLDPETLEAVLTELGRLRAGGRVVGVVSHVEALKQSIADRIEVRRLPDGSSTLTVRAG